ncbi:MAG: tRNA (adenosine(37)-N6)-threonylcarbamoyltransferase complex dimerization subunit type 1 TsaB [Thermodesulfobacteriota bacterium]
MILAIDTSSRSGSIALVDGGLLKSERTVAHAGPHAGWLLSNIAALLTDSSVTLDDIDLYAVAIGPGSFTGLRIGITTVKGLAWSHGRPTAGVSTLEALALNAPFAGIPVCPVLDARKSEVYSALYTFAGRGAPSVVMEPAAIRPELLLARLNELYPEPAPILFMGAGLGVYGEYIKKNRKGALLAPEPLWFVRASNIAFLAAGKDVIKETPIELTPYYLRKSEAEIRKRAAMAIKTP